MLEISSKIAVFYEPKFYVSRQAVTGILRYANALGPWIITLQESSNRPSVPKGCRGILFCSPTAIHANALARMGLPTVLINFTRIVGNLTKRARALPFVQYNSSEFGTRAAEFFLSRHPRAFAYVGLPSAQPWDVERGEAFAARLRKEKQVAHIYPIPTKPLSAVREAVRLQKWLKSLPRPLAILAGNDTRAQEVLNACQSAGITVPFEAIILGVDNDEWLCESTFPRLSSMPYRTDEIGYAGAKMLDEILRHKDNPDLPLPPLRRYMTAKDIIERESTDGRVVTDPIVSKALSCIQLSKGLGLHAADVAKAIGLSQNWIETRFRQELGTSIIDEIARVRLKTILYLIKETDTPFIDIAHRCGFTAVSTLCRLVKQETGQTMSDLRT